MSLAVNIIFDKRFNEKCDNIEIRKGKYTDIDRGKVEGVEEQIELQFKLEGKNNGFYSQYHKTTTN